MHISRRCARIEAFLDRVKDEYDFILERNCRYMNWRYADKRAGHYEIFLAKSDNDVLGILVLMLTEDQDYPEASIADLIVPSNRVDVGYKLIEFICERCDNRDINKMSCFGVRGTPLLAMAVKMGSCMHLI
jgi:hypothetical protein